MRSYSVDMEFRVGDIRKLWRWRVVMAKQQCEYLMLLNPTFKHN
jgi:hypothetical protein